MPGSPFHPGVTPEHLSPQRRKRHPPTSHSGTAGKTPRSLLEKAREAGLPSAWRLGDGPIRKTVSAEPRKIWHLLWFSKGRVGNRPEVMAERTRGSPFATAFQSSNTGSQDWRVSEGASGVNTGETQGQGPCTHCRPQRDLLATDSLPPLGPRLAAGRAVGISMGRGPVLPGTWHVLPFGTVENSRSHSGPPVDRVTFHLPCLQAQANAHTGKNLLITMHIL